MSYPTYTQKDLEIYHEWEVRMEQIQEGYISKPPGHNSLVNRGSNCESNFPNTAFNRIKRFDIKLDIMT